MVVEGAVFGRHHGVDCVFGNGVERSPLAAFHEVFVCDFSVHVVDVGDKFRVDLLQLSEGREFRQVVVIDDYYHGEADNDGNAQNGEANEELLVRKEFFQE